MDSSTEFLMGLFSPTDQWVRVSSITIPPNKLSSHSRVNLAGLFTLEPLTTPWLFQKYSPARDEWDLSAAMANDTSEGGGLEQIEEHYRTFIVSASTYLSPSVQ